MLDHSRVAAHVDDAWRRDVVPRLVEFGRIPNISPMFDPDWESHGFMLEAAEFLANWCGGRPLPGIAVELFRRPGRTPLLLVDVPEKRRRGQGRPGDTVILYGHLDKQPEMSGWREGLGPWDPVIEGDRLFGRGTADDGYAIFAALTAIEALDNAGGDRPHCVVLIEASEESGSPDLPAYLDELGLPDGRLGNPSLVIGLDASAASYDRLWVTTSMRGLTSGVLTVRMLTEGVHSGVASGIVPSSFRIVRQLLDRIEDATNGYLQLKELHADIPPWGRAQAEATVTIAGDGLADLPFVSGARPVETDPVELQLNGTWRPTLSYIGMEGMPERGNAGNVLRPFTTLILSFRLPPDVDPEVAGHAVRQALTADPPYGAQVSYDVQETSRGWASSTRAPWLEDALHAASMASFGKPPAAIALGGTIPFMAMLGSRYPAAQFAITGVLGPGSNAHGPNEFLHLPTARNITAVVSHLLAAHTVRPAEQP